MSRRFFLALSWTTSSWRGVKNLFRSRQQLTLLLICQRNDSFDSWLWNGFLERALRIKPNNIIAFSFFLSLFNYAIQRKFITWLVNSALNWSDSCDIGFQVQFNAEFTSQVMYFPIACIAPIFTECIAPKTTRGCHRSSSCRSFSHGFQWESLLWFTCEGDLA